MKAPNELTDRFRSQGLKVTPQRQAIFEILHGNEAHPTAEAVHARVVQDMPMVSLRTVYQTLNDLTAMGELGQIRVGTGPARFDPNLVPHHHLLCDLCGRVDDVAADHPDVAVATDFEVTRTEIVFRGRCTSCRPSGSAVSSTIPSTTTTTKEA